MAVASRLKAPGGAHERSPTLILTTNEVLTMPHSKCKTRHWQQTMGWYMPQRILQYKIVFRYIRVLGTHTLDSNHNSCFYNARIIPKFWLHSSFSQVKRLNHRSVNGHSSSPPALCHDLDLQRRQASMLSCQLSLSSGQQPTWSFSTYRKAQQGPK